MDISFDENKRLRVLADRGLCFEDAAGMFEGFHLTRRDDRYEYGEDRFISVGEIKGEVVFVVWTLRDDSRRIITMWKASNGESEKYHARRCDSG